MSQTRRNGRIEGTQRFFMKCYIIDTDGKIENAKEKVNETGS
jgi:hypothetical protein